jgi:hypothetical protein
VQAQEKRQRLADDKGRLRKDRADNGWQRPAYSGWEIYFGEYSMLHSRAQQLPHQT